MTLVVGPNLGVLLDAAVGEAHPNEFRKVLRAIDCFLPGLSVKSRTTAAQPASPANGDRYILPTSPTGTAWAGKAAGTVAYYSTSITTTSGGVDSTASGWDFYTPKRNWQARVEDESDLAIRHNGTTWV
jgi:hypothetical protein